MDYPQPPVAPIAIQLIRELTSPQTLRFFVVIVLLGLVGFEIVTAHALEPLRDPFMLIVGTMFEPALNAVRPSPAGK